MDTRDQILSSAQRLVQQRGFNGFSYADVADEVGIRKASLHHHFPSKSDLGLALIERYSADTERGLERISSENSRADERLNAYVSLYSQALAQNRMCLCGVLASEALTLDEALRPKIDRFFARNIEWLTEVLAAGKSQRLFVFTGSAADHARLLLSSLQGAMLMARASGDRDGFSRTADMLMKGLKTKS
jgi:TetR/AcrR family transcriptional regulator, transcriptional repressor for nem operon